MNILLGPFDSVPRVAAEAILNSVWQSAALAFFVFVLLLLFKRAGAATKYRVWTAALLAVVCLVFLNAYTSWRTAAAKDDATPGGGRAEISKLSTLTAPSNSQLPASASVVAETRAGAMVGDETAGISFEADATGNHGVSEVAHESLPRRESFSIRLRGERWPQLFLIFWVLGSSLMVVRLVRSYLSLRRVRRESRPLAEQYQQRMSHWAKTCGIRRKVSLRGSKQIAAPLMLGLRQTTILFPEKLADRLDEDEFDQVLLHELAHVRRRDDWGNLAQKLVEAVFFFHPVVLWVGRQVSAERECACDQWVVTLTGAHRSYASCLTKLFELTKTPHAAFWAPGVVPVRSHLSRRVETILKSRRNQSSRLSAVGLLLPLCLILTTMIHMGRHSPFIAVSAGEVSAAESAEHAAPRAAARPEKSQPENDGINEWVEHLPGEARVSGGVRLLKDGEATTKSPSGDSMASDSFTSPSSRDDVPQPHQWPVIDVAADDRVLTAALPINYVLPARSPRPEVSNHAAPPSGNSAPGIQATAATSATPSSEESHLPEDFFKRVAALGNSGSQREILSALLKRRGLSKENLTQALLASKSIDSDGEKAEFLVGAAGVSTGDPEVLNAFFHAASSINSDGERRRVLSAILVSKPRHREVLYRALKAAAAINSDGEKAELLVKAAGLYAVDKRALSAFLDAVSSVNSSAEQRRALTALLRQSGLSNEAVIQTVRFARRITSDGEKAEFLTRVAEVCQLNDGVLAAYLSTASSINSSTEQARALSAISKRKETGRGAATQTGPVAVNNGTGD